MREESNKAAAGTFRSAGFFLLAEILMLAAFVAASVVFSFQRMDTAVRYLLSAGGELLLAVPVVLYMLLRRVKPSSLFGRAGAGQVALAALSGFLLVPLSIAVGMLWNLIVLATGGNIRVEDTPIPETGLQLLAALLAAGVAAPAVEEPMARGVLLSAGAGVFKRNGSLLCVTAAFALIHGRFLGLPSIFLGGLLLGVLVWRSGSLWPGVAAHAAYNTATVLLETLLHGIQASGLLPSGRATPQISDMLASTVAYFVVSLPFIALFGVALWGFRKITPRVERKEPEPGKVHFSYYWPWLLAFLLLLCYMSIDVLRVYGIIGVT